jgi:hypothetical protein
MSKLWTIHYLHWMSTLLKTWWFLVKWQCFTPSRQSNEWTQQVCNTGHKIFCKNTKNRSILTIFLLFTFLLCCHFLLLCRQKMGWCAKISWLTSWKVDVSQSQHSLQICRFMQIKQLQMSWLDAWMHVNFQKKKGVGVWAMSELCTFTLYQSKYVMEDKCWSKV